LVQLGNTIGQIFVADPVGYIGTLTGMKVVKAEPVDFTRRIYVFSM
jgi:hypothetical protein